VAQGKGVYEGFGWVEGAGPKYEGYARGLAVNEVENELPEQRAAALCSYLFSLTFH
jgi:hypothetical protein